MSRRIRWAYAAFLLVLIAMTILVAELWILPSKLEGLSRETYLMGFAATPGTRVDDTRINAMGFTGNVIQEAKAPGTIRILTLGGSAMFNRRMTERLIERFEAATSARVEVLGAALRTHTTRASVLKYGLLARYGFDYVLIYHGINDLWANHGPEGSFRADYSQLGPWYVRNALLDHSLLARMAYNRWFYSKLGMIESKGIARTNQAGFAATESFRGNLTELLDSAEAHGAVPVLMTMAWSLPSHYTYRAFADREVGYNNPEDYDRFPAELWGTPDFVRDGLRRHNDIVRELARNRNLPLIDQEHSIGKELRWFGDVCHLSDEGTDRFVDNIVRTFVDRGWIP